jgi:hypothetical protein
METACISVLHHFGLKYIDDNAPIHRGSVVQQWKNDHGVQALDWPPYSPDLNPIENVWSYLKMQLRKLPNRPQNLIQLHDAVSVAWDGVPQSYIRNLYESMPQRMRDCIKAHGYPTRY